MLQETNQTVSVHWIDGELRTKNLIESAKNAVLNILGHKESWNETIKDESLATELSIVSGLASRNRIRSVLFSNDERHILSAANDGTIKRWDLNSNQPFFSNIYKTTKANTDPITCLALSVDGSQMLAGGNCLTLWNLDSAELLSETSLTAPVNAIAWKNDHIVAGFYDGSMGKFQKHTQQLTLIWKTHQLGLNAQDLSFEDAIGAFDKALLGHRGAKSESNSDLSSEVSSMHTSGSQPSRIEGKFKTHGSKVGDERAAQKAIFTNQRDIFSFDCNYNGSLAVSGGDHTVKLWKIKEAKMQEIISIEHTGIVRCVVFSPDGRLFISVGSNTLKLWDSSGQLLNSIDEEEEIQSVAFSPTNGAWLVAGTGNKLKIWDVNQLKNKQGHSALVKETETGKDVVTSIAFDSAGSRIFCGSGEELLLWEWSGNEKRLKKIKSGKHYNFFLLYPCFDRFENTENPASEDGCIANRKQLYYCLLLATRFQ